MGRWGPTPNGRWAEGSCYRAAEHAAQHIARQNRPRRHRGEHGGRPSMVLVETPEAHGRIKRDRDATGQERSIEGVEELGTGGKNDRDAIPARQSERAESPGRFSSALSDLAVREIERALMAIEKANAVFEA